MASCKSAWVQFISLAGLAKYTEPRSNTVVSQESAPIKWRCFPSFVKFHPVNNGSPQIVKKGGVIAYIPPTVVKNGLPPLEDAPHPRSPAI